MSTDAISGPLHLTVEADVQVTDPARLGDPSEAQLGEAIAALIRRHAWEAGLQVTDPRSVRVSVTRG